MILINEIKKGNKICSCLLRKQKIQSNWKKLKKEIKNLHFFIIFNYPIIEGNTIFNSTTIKRVNCTL